MPGRLQGKVAFITGAGSGIGLACARLFAREGGHVVIAELMPTLGRAAESEILEAAGQALFVQTDVTDEASIARALEATLLRFGALHVLVNCAGGSVPKDGPVTDIDVSVWDHSLTLDLKGTFLCCRHAIPHLVSSGGGSVVNFSSMVALLGRPVHAYSAAKGGVLSLTRALAASYGPKRVRVNAICRVWCSPSASAPESRAACSVHQSMPTFARRLIRSRSASRKILHTLRSSWPPTNPA